MYLFETNLGEVFKPRPKYQKAQLQSVSQRWSLEIPFRKDFGAFRQELSNAIRPLVTAKTDQTEIDRLLLKDKAEERTLKGYMISCGNANPPRSKNQMPLGFTLTLASRKSITRISTPLMYMPFKNTVRLDFSVTGKRRSRYRTVLRFPSSHRAILRAPEPV
jgi:hypothetical protein